jgi:hypothetical protein
MDQKLLKDFLHASSSRQIKDTAQSRGEPFNHLLNNHMKVNLLICLTQTQVQVPNVLY